MAAMTSGENRQKIAEMCRQVYKPFGLINSRVKSFDRNDQTFQPKVDKTTYVSFEYEYVNELSIFLLNSKVIQTRPVFFYISFLVLFLKECCLFLDLPLIFLENLYWK